MKQACLLNIIIALIFSSSLKAQDPDIQKYNNYIGINAGYTSGLGFTYGYWPGKLGAQISILPISTDENTLYSVSLTPFFAFHRSQYFKGYVFLGNHFVSNKNDTEYNIGFGPGFEAGSRVVFSLRGGIGLFDVTDTFCILPTIGAGLYFKF